MNIVHLEIEKELAALEKPLIVSQFTFDEINIALFNLLDKPTMYIGKKGDRYTMSELTNEVHSTRKIVLQRARQFARERTKIMGIAKALDENTDKLRQAYDVIGRAAYSTLLLSTEGKRCLLADDIVLRQLLRERTGSAGASLYSALAVMLQKNILIEETFTEKICKLAHSSYRFLPVRAQDLIYSLEKTHGSVDRTSSTMMNLLSDPAIPAENAAGIAAEFLRLVYFKIVIAENRGWITRVLLRMLARRGDRVRTFRVLRNAVQNLFSMMPIQSDEILSEIEAVEVTTGIAAR